MPVVLTLIILAFLVGASFMAPQEASALWGEGLSGFHILPEDFSISFFGTPLYARPSVGIPISGSLHCAVFV